MSDEVKKGLLGIVVDETEVSKVMPEINSLTYRGYAVQDLCLYSKNGSLVLTVCDKKNETSNSYEVPVGTTTEDDLCYCFKVENLRLQPEEYNVTIYDNRCALFDAVNRDLQYFIALEPQ